MIRGCSCGEPHDLGGAEPFIEKQIAERGATILVGTAQGPAWAIPRLYIAAHGIKMPEVPNLAEIYGWERS